MKFRKLNARGFSHHFVMVLIVLIVAIGGTYYLVASHADVPQAQLSIAPIEPATETTSNGSDVVVGVDITTNGNAVSKFQSTLSYPVADFSVVSVQPAVPSTFNSSGSNGSIQFSGTAATPVNGVDVRLVTVTLKAINTGITSVPAAVNLASLCPPTGEYPPTCSAAYGLTTTNGSSTTSRGSSTTSSGPSNLLNSMNGYTYNILPTPAAPTNLTATVASSSQINLNWTASPNPGGYIAGYYLYRYSPNVGTSTTSLDATINNPNATSFSVTGLEAGSAYSFYLEAYNTSSPPLVSSASNTALAAIPSPPIVVSPPIIVKPPTPTAPSSSSEELSIPPQRRPAQYLSLCDVGKTGYVSDGTSNCWAGGSLIENYSPSVAGTYYDVPCVSVSANSKADRFVYIASGEVCPEQTTAVPLQLSSGEQLSFPPAKRPTQYLTQCMAGNVAYVALDSCVYRVPSSIYEFTYTPPVAGTYYSVPCATVTQGGLLRYLYVSSTESCPSNTFGNLSSLTPVRIAQPL